jgi:alcohol-forming fatty acyl-CoA reductase
LLRQFLIEVVPAWKEPVAGWVDSLNGPVGVMGTKNTFVNFQNPLTFVLSVAGGKGVIRSMLCEAEYTAEVIPVDQAISGLIGIAYTVASMKEK